MLYRCTIKTINYTYICVYIIILLCIMFMISVFEGLKCGINLVFVILTIYKRFTMERDGEELMKL